MKWYKRRTENQQSYIERGMLKLIFVLLLSCVFCLKPSFKNALRNKVIIDFKNAITPIISKKFQHLTLPDIHTSHSGFKISISRIHVDIHPINPNQISIVFVPNSSIIRFSTRGLGLGGGAHIHAKWHFISKSFGASVGISGAGFDCQISLYSHNGKPNIKVDSISIHTGHISIHLHGDIITKILEFVANKLKGHFAHEIAKQLQHKLPPEITKEVNNKLDHLPTDIDIGQGLVMRYGFPYAPHVKKDYLFTGITAYVHTKKNPNPPPYQPVDVPEFDAANAKGIQFFMADYVIKTSLDASNANGLLVASFEKDMLGHHIKMVCKATKVPIFAFKNAIDVDLAAQCGVDVDRNPSNHFTLIAELKVNLKEYIKKAVVFFSISTAHFTKLEYKQDHPVDIEWFKKGINTVLDVVKQIVNADLGQRGIPLPTIPGVDYTDTVQYIKNGYMEICTNPVFHFQLLISFAFD
eukprot:TRINITY_DN532_c0_g2_i1.p1 TRINITY_DN532_c0_g2~~TRINITY_DN532_c0_g2_i1.p1  ORF type:complete len:467 (+),score=52.54 TRINITY_DN532_c0_g2_i1:157-1557(+)